MMKQAILGLLLFTSFLYGSAQTVPGKDTLYFKDLDHMQMMQWDSIERAWSINSLQPFFKKHKIKISCGGCSRFMMDICFQVGADGNAIPQLLSVKRCSVGLSPKQTEELKKLLLKIKFTDAFYNRTYRLNISRVLKC